MKKLNFPIIRKDLLLPPVLSMDEYLKFVEFNLKYVVDRKAYRELKKKQIVNVPFRLK